MFQVFRFLRWALAPRTSPHARSRRSLALSAAVILIAFVLPAPSNPARAQEAAPAGSETRGLWVLRSSLTSPAAIAALVRTAKDQGFNTLLVQVRGRADAYYTTDLEPRASDLARQPAAFDPLATLLAEARPQGIRVHAWVSVNLVSSAAALPASAEHLVYRHPEWLMVPRAVAQDLAKLDPGNPAYVGKIARWTRAESEIAEFRAEIRPKIASEARRALDADEATDLFAYPDRFPAEWTAFRRARLTALVSRIREGVRAARPSALLTAAVFPDPQDAFSERMQDWRGWLGSRLVDAVAPMAYTQEPARFAEQIAAARDIAGGRVIWAGIGAYRLTPAQTIENIQAARRLGAGGFVLFSYDSLTGPKPPAPDYLPTVSRAFDK